MFRVLDHDRHQRDHDDRQDDPREMRLYRRDASEEIAGRHEQADPEQGTGDAERDVAQIRHAADPCNEWRERPHERNEARDDDGLAAVTGIELVRALERTLVEESSLAFRDLVS